MTRPRWRLVLVALTVSLAPVLLWAIQFKGNTGAICSQGLDAGRNAWSASVGYASGDPLGPLLATPAADTTPTPVPGGIAQPYPAPQMTTSAAAAPSPYGGTYPTPNPGVFSQDYPAPTTADAAAETKKGGTSNVVLGISLWQIGAGAVVGLAVGFVLGRRGKSA